MFIKKKGMTYLWVENTNLFCLEAPLKTRYNAHHHYHYI